MSIKVTLSPQKTNEEKPFPKLMINDFGLLVFFQSYAVGTALYPGSTVTEVGKYFNQWPMQMFTDYEGSITLQNE